MTADAIEAAYRRALEVADAASLDEVGARGSDVEDRPPQGRGPAVSGQTSEGAAAESVRSAAEEGRVLPRQVVEALLFVGGQALTGKRLADLLGDGFAAEHVEEMIAGLNEQYTRENRPYEVRLSEGGYRMVLRAEFERVRHRVYGLGPKDVKLSQDALEVLALVAYQQPVTRVDVEATGKPNAAALLRQLLRRELIRLERGDGSADDVRYFTTSRFLQLFGLASLDDLPRAEDVVFK
jgi:segregation and condensation protein B